jgi:2',3'-cyclic-nucleotide 2'-phosphodiesterase (5'-nucleotidase family)
MLRKVRCLAILTVVLAVYVPMLASGAPIPFTILHTNDVHGQLQASGSNPGIARVATVVNGIRTAGLG